MRRILEMLSAWRGPVFYVEAIRRDGTHCPLEAQFGKREAAVRFVLMRWMDNKDPNVVGYAVINAEQDVVFTAPEGVAR